jgi:predicted HNH restriction endonuclease
LPIEILKEEVPQVPWNSLRASGIAIHDDAAVQRLNAIWKAHLKKRNIQAPDQRIDAVADFGNDTSGYEGILRRVLANKYERKRWIRDACIRHYGPVCSVCEFDFGETYGQVGAGFIHIHHLVELASKASERKVDAVKDLRPVCANCHCMLHCREPALTIEELKRFLAAARSKARRKIPR